MTSTPVQNGNHVRPFADKSQYNYPKLTITPNPQHFKNANTPIRYSEITAKVIDYVAQRDPIDITTGRYAPVSIGTNGNNNSGNNNQKESIYFRILIEATHTNHELRGFKDPNDNWASTEELVPYTVQWTIFRRFNEFHRLYDSLTGHYFNIPQIPPKEYFSLVRTATSGISSNNPQKWDDVFLTKRMLGLSTWLNSLLNELPAVLHSEDMDQFLQLHQHIVLETSEFPERTFTSSNNDFCYGITDVHWNEEQKTVFVTGEDGSYLAKADARAGHFFTTSTTYNGAVRVFGFNDDNETIPLDQFTAISPTQGQNNQNNQNDGNNNYSTDKIEKSEKSEKIETPPLSTYNLDLSRNLKVHPFNLQPDLFSSRASCVAGLEFEPFGYHLPLLKVNSLSHFVKRLIFPNYSQSQYPETTILPTTHIKPGPLYIPQLTQVLADPSTLADATNPHSRYITQSTIVKADSNAEFVFFGFDNGEVHIFQYNAPSAKQDQCLLRNITHYKPHSQRVEKISFVHIFPTPLSTLSPDEFMEVNVEKDLENDDIGFSGLLTSSRDGQINFFDLKSGQIFRILDPLVAQYGAIAHHYWDQYNQVLYFTTFNGYSVAYSLVINTRTNSILPRPIHATQYYSDCIRRLQHIPAVDLGFQKAFNQLNYQNQQDEQSITTYSNQIFAMTNYETNHVDIIDFQHKNESSRTIHSQENFPMSLFSIPLLKFQCKRILILPLYLPPQQKITAKLTSQVSFAQPMIVVEGGNVNPLLQQPNPQQQQIQSPTQQLAREQISYPSNSKQSVYVDTTSNPLSLPSIPPVSTIHTPFFYLISGHANGLVAITIFNIFNQKSSLLYVFNAHSEEITGLVYVPKRDMIVTTSRDKTLAGWKIPFPRSYIERIL